MKKILISLVITVMLISAMGITSFAHMGLTDSNGGHFVQSSDKTQAIAYHFHKGVYAGWECLITDYVKWNHREDILPLVPGDDKGTWREFKKDYNLTFNEAYYEGDDSPNNYGLGLACKIKVNGYNMITQNPRSFKGTELLSNITLQLKDANGNIRYEGIVENYKLNDDGATYVPVVMELQPNEEWEQKTLSIKYGSFGGYHMPKTFKYTVKFTSCFMVDFNGTYPIPTEKPTASPVPTTTATSTNTDVTPTVAPSDATSSPDVTATSTSVAVKPTEVGYISYTGGNALPKTGESESSRTLFMSIGLLLVVSGIVTVVMVKKRKAYNRN